MTAHPPEWFSERVRQGKVGSEAAGWHSPGVQRAVHRAFAERLPPGAFVDLGCGAGDFVQSIPGRQADYVGVDASPEMVALARRAYPGWRFYVGNLVRWPASPGVVCIGLVGNAEFLDLVLGRALEWCVVDTVFDPSVIRPRDGWEFADVAQVETRWVMSWRKGLCAAKLEPARGAR